MDRSIALVLVAALVGSAAAPLSVGLAAEPKAPTFADLVRNTKEADSILIRNGSTAPKNSDAQDEEEPLTPEEKYPEATAHLFEKMPRAFALLSASMDPKDDTHPPTEPCEPLVLARLQSEMKNLGLPSDSGAVLYGLEILRKVNLIDDVTLLPLLSTFPAWKKLGYVESDWVKKDSEGRSAQLMCPTDQELELALSVKTEKGRKFKRKNISERIAKIAKEERDAGSGKKEPRYLPVQIAWLNVLTDVKFDTETPFTLPSVLKEVEAAKGTSSRADPDDTKTKVMSDKKKKSGGLSNRLALYGKYNGLQISILSDTFRKFTERMTAVSAEVRIKYGDGREDEVYQLSPQEQYRMAAKMLHKEVEEMKLSSLFSGRSPTFDDVIVAGVETGFIHAKELDAALSVDDLWNPVTPGWQKVWNIVKKYGTTALILIPPPGNVFASLAVGLVEAFVQMKTSKAGAGDDRGISIF